MDQITLTLRERLQVGPSSMNQATRRVLVIHAGGTVGMWKNPEGPNEPKRRHLERLMAAMPELNPPRDPIPTFELAELAELLDSSAMTPRNWQQIAERICAGCDRYDGFVVLHGTDTMGYTASALSFLLRDLGHPVILTGSQIPLQEQRTDAREHLLTSMILAATSGIPEVCVYFHGELLRGNRTTKVDADGYNAFDSPNYPTLGQVGVRIEIDAAALGPGPRAGHQPGQVPMGPPQETFPVGTFRVYPGIDPRPVERMIPSGPEGFGLVLETFGAGNAPEKRLRPVLARAIDDGVVVVNVTQCLRGTVNLALYATGSWMEEIGVTSGLDMTPEAAVTKLFYLMRLYPERRDAARTRELMAKNLRGELSARRSFEA